MTVREEDFSCVAVKPLGNVMGSGCVEVEFFQKFVKKKLFVGVSRQFLDGNPHGFATVGHHFSFKSGNLPLVKVVLLAKMVGVACKGWDEVWIDFGKFRENGETDFVALLLFGKVGLVGTEAEVVACGVVVEFIGREGEASAPQV